MKYKVNWYQFTQHPNSDSCWSLSVGPDGKIYAAACCKKASAYKAVQSRTAQWTQRYEIDAHLAIVDIREESERIDLTQLLLAGQRLARVAVVRNRNLQTLNTGMRR